MGHVRKRENQADLPSVTNAGSTDARHVRQAALVNDDTEVPRASCQDSPADCHDCHIVVQDGDGGAGGADTGQGGQTALADDGARLQAAADSLNHEDTALALQLQYPGQTLPCQRATQNQALSASTCTLLQFEGTRLRCRITTGPLQSFSPRKHGAHLHAFQRNALAVAPHGREVCEVKRVLGRCPQPLQLYADGHLWKEHR